VSVFVDTSAIYALLAARDRNHSEARRIFEHLIDADVLLTTNYVLFESTSLVHARHGRRPLAALEALVDVLETIWIDDDVHTAAFSRLVRRGRQGPSFVDLVSFETMRRHDVGSAFAFDDDFEAEGFARVAAPAGPPT
jgi:predicted nucleic acid-binding protein